MKKICLLSLGLVFLFLSQLNAAVLTVSNNVGKPAQYTDIQDAHDAANVGDTLLITGSLISYGNLYITKPIVVIGPGYNKPVEEQSTIESLLIGYNIDRLSNVKIIGLVITSCQIASSMPPENSVYSNISVEQCYITSSLRFNSYINRATFLNNSIRNCILSNVELYLLGLHQETLINNNIFENSSVHSKSDYTLEKINCRNNLFINRFDNTFINTFNLIIENNIFFKSEPQGCTDCAFNHNVTFGNTNNIIPGPDNVGTGNFIEIDPEFINYDGWGGFDYEYDFDLKATSPLKYAGTDGSDIGIYGGVMPFIVGLNPPIPVMLELTLPKNQSAVKQGGTINVSFKATKQ